ncbi:MAG: sigma-70 family RNA polymerase sigma factor [Myxococcota bacterium]
MDLGDPAALFQRFGPAIYRRCLAMLKSRALAEDTTQEVFMRAVTHRENFRGEASPFTWLYRVATTLCLQQLRNTKRRDEKLRAISIEESRPNDPAERLDLLRVLADEDEQSVTIAYLRFVDELTMEEVADVVGLSRKTVHKRIEELKQRIQARAGAGT